MRRALPPLLLGVEKGFFREAGIEPEPLAPRDVVAASFLEEAPKTLPRQ